VALVGPRGVGKSTVAEQLAARLGCACHCVDGHALAYYDADPRFAAAHQPGASLVDTLARLAAQLGSGYYEFEEALHVLAIEQVVGDPPAPVIDFGAGHTALNHPAHRTRAMQLLARLPCVCLWPSRSLARSVDLLATRAPSLAPELIAWELERDYSRELADCTIHVEDASPQQVIGQVLDHLR
jgi:hypothetical protein